MHFPNQSAKVYPLGILYLAKIFYRHHKIPVTNPWFIAIVGVYKFDEFISGVGDSERGRVISGELIISVISRYLRIKPRYNSFKISSSIQSKSPHL